MNNLTLNFADGVEVTPEQAGTGSYIKVEVTGVSIDNILDQIPIKEAIDYYGKEKLLDAIGKDDAAIHFDLVPEEEQ